MFILSLIIFIFGILSMLILPIVGAITANIVTIQGFFVFSVIIILVGIVMLAAV